MIDENVKAEEVEENTSEEVAEKETEKKDSKVKAENKKLVKENEQLKQENKKLTEENADVNDKYLRIAAEYDNFRRRSLKEKENIYADAYTEALSEFLPVLDNLDRAKSFSDNENLEKGLQAIANQVASAMEKLGITAFGEAGEKFDPELHNAVMHVDDDNLEENVITDVFQKGYKKGDRIIRHAMVKVAN
ncbi:MAG: nucleotide exchange factor GrpE [Clostridia bacterium]|nr:nucleotide exchange factor GrpE [Clostridia bacterium]